MYDNLVIHGFPGMLHVITCVCNTLYYDIEYAADNGQPVVGCSSPFNNLTCPEGHTYPPLYVDSAKLKRREQDKHIIVFEICSHLVTRCVL